MAKGGCTTLAVMATFSNPDVDYKYFSGKPPRLVGYNVYPHREPGSDTPPEEFSNSNALCFLFRNTEKGTYTPDIQYTASWIDADSSEPARDAILCLGSRLFWEDWILPLLENVNQATFMNAGGFFSDEDSFSMRLTYTIANSADQSHLPNYTATNKLGFPKKEDPMGDWVWERKSGHGAMQFENSGTKWSVEQEGKLVVAMASSLSSLTFMQ